MDKPKRINLFADYVEVSQEPLSILSSFVRRFSFLHVLIIEANSDCYGKDRLFVASFAF